MKLEKLQTFLESAAIPRAEQLPKTFLEIAKQPHYEVVLSNIYAFFFNINEEHGFGSLFIDSLITLIGQKSNKAFNVKAEFSVETEKITLRGGRIDILLFNSEQAIIIENKVYHTLENDLFDYWNSIKRNEKVGIVLSLKPADQYDLKKAGFINILHRELLDEVYKNNKVIDAAVSSKYQIFLEDLFHNTIKLSTKMDRKKLEFYFQHQKEIKALSTLENSVRNHVRSEIDRAILDLDYKLIGNASNSNTLAYYRSAKNSNLMLTIIFNNVLSSKRQLEIIIEVNGKEIKKCQELTKDSFEEGERKIITDWFYTTDKKWAHFAYKSYHLSEPDIENLSVFIQSKINQENYLNIFQRLEAHLCIPK